MAHDYDHIRALINANRLDEAAEILAAHPACESPVALYLQGRIEWRRGNRGRAISCYEAAVAADPESEAAVALEQARQIMDFFNTDLYNP
ncbi:MAG: tetratricopeptide repeat protein [Muribaculaceae bacterium]|nr:tetratricopeptide repeat protein [Muribaculaceae bacterium]